MIFSLSLGNWTMIHHIPVGRLVKWNVGQSYYKQAHICPQLVRHLNSVEKSVQDDEGKISTAANWPLPVITSSQGLSEGFQKCHLSSTVAHARNLNWQTKMGIYNTISMQCQKHPNHLNNTFTILTVCSLFTSWPFFLSLNKPEYSTLLKIHCTLLFSCACRGIVT